MLLHWTEPILLDLSSLFRPGAVCLGVLGATARLMHFGSLDASRCNCESSCLGQVPPAGLFSLPVPVQTETVNREPIFTRQRLMCEMVKRGMETSGNSPYFLKLPPELWAWGWRSVNTQ